MSQEESIIDALGKITREVESQSVLSMGSEQIRQTYLGKESVLAQATKQIKSLDPQMKKSLGKTIQNAKAAIEEAIAKTETSKSQTTNIDTTAPGVLPPYGSLHIVTQTIEEVTDIFKYLGFARVRHPEVDWDWYAFESLNMPDNHPARDEWETFFVNYPGMPEKPDRTMVLTPHTSNGQVREMEKGSVPIRMINIAKCYRRQSDVSHTPMFHQFEGLYIEKDVSIAHLKGVFDYFVKQYYGKNREIRLRPFHFQFTEPSFEVDISCGICHGVGCRLCKEGWLELGGAGMVHPTVLKNGGIDTSTYNGFAFGWGIERTYMMKSGTQIDDIRLLYENNVQFLNQF